MLIFDLIIKKIHKNILTILDIRIKKNGNKTNVRLLNLIFLQYEFP